jgi:protoporphyrinogen oxidase
LKSYKYIILGAGPSGLTVAHALLNAGVRRQDLLVIEKEEFAGGLCRSEIVDGTPLDIGGGHFLDVRRKEVLDFLFRFMPQSEWNLFDRVSRIRLRGQEIEHPLEANLWQLSKEDQVDYLESIARAGSVRGEPQPTAFADWVTWKLGDRIAQEYMLPYNRKIWAMDPNMLGTYWLYKLPDVSFRDTLRSCLEGRPFGALPAHGTFYYPKNHGYGEVWRRMGEALGECLVSKCPVESVDITTRTVNGRWSADTLITTIPWTLWQGFAALPDDISKHVSRLKKVPIDVDYVPTTLDNTSHWIYEPDESISYHRMLLRSNFCTGSKGYWTESNAARSGAPANFRHCNEFAYPVNTIGKPEAIEEVLKWASARAIVGIGRWGRWEHMNSDVAVAEALAAARSLAGA